MITNYKIQGYKSLVNIDLDFKNLNLLTGLNGSGKSSLLQTMLLLRQSKESLNSSEPQLLLDERNLLGSKLLFDAGQVFDVIPTKNISVEFQNRPIIFKMIYNKTELNFNFYIADNLLRTNKITVYPLQRIFSPTFFSECSLFNDNFQYIFAERSHSQDSYTNNVKDTIVTKDFGIKGKNVPFYLASYGDREIVNLKELYHPKSKSEYLIDQVDAWLGEISPNMSVYSVIFNDATTEIKYGNENNAYHPKHVGFGLSYVLPIIVTLLTARKDKLIIIENPEAHIHPKGQVELGKLFAKAAQAGVQLFIETHSDHILNGIRIAARNGEVDADKVGFFHFKREDDESKVSSILVDSDGKLYQKDEDGKRIGIPKDFFNEWVDSMAQLF